MIRASAKAALLIAAASLAACETGPMLMGGPPRSPMDGQWASTDGIFVASFQRGQFTSRFTKTNEVLAQGSYSSAGGNIQMQWLSVATQQRRSASCAFTGDDSVHCNQAGGGGFDLRRTG